MKSSFKLRTFQDLAIDPSRNRGLESELSRRYPAACSFDEVNCHVLMGLSSGDFDKSEKVKHHPSTRNGVSVPAC
jgi:hypothetical protein